MAPPGLRPRGFSFSGATVNRCIFLVDGLNLYHSTLDAERATGRRSRRLDVSALCRAHLHALPGRSEARQIVLFSAVAIGSRLLEVVCRDLCDTVVLVTGDTDLVPAVSAARRLDANKRLGVLQPYGRANRELARAVDFALTIKADTYARHQFAGA